MVLIILRTSGTYLVRQDRLQHADAILILMGSIADRILEADTLYRQGFANKIIMVNDNQYNSLEMKARGIAIPTKAVLSADALAQMGVPEEDITIIPCGAASTQAESIAVRNYIKPYRDMDTIILVSSPSHTRRASMIFKKAFSEMNRPIVIYTSPSKYNSYTGEKWWTDREDIQQVVFEYIKMVNFLVFEQWEL